MISESGEEGEDTSFSKDDSSGSGENLILRFINLKLGKNAEFSKSVFL
jgi:hypothetical protein